LHKQSAEWLGPLAILIVRGKDQIAWTSRNFEEFFKLMFSNSAIHKITKTLALPPENFHDLMLFVESNGF
jgi:hypothetical protein